MIEQKDLAGALLADRLLGLARDSERRDAMGRAARTFARPDAATAIVERALELSGCQDGPDEFTVALAEVVRSGG